MRNIKEPYIYPRYIGKVLDQALATSQPVIIEAVVDPFVPPMPPKITARQAVKFAESLVKGKPNRKRSPGLSCRIRYEN
jgi:pyruvate dehydrogenase (quinone)